MFTPSKYQSAIFKAVETSTSNIIVEAVAGSGKSKTIEIVNSIIPGNKTRKFLAFNKAIATELASRGINASTLHSVAFNALRKFTGTRSRTWLNDKKYSELIEGYADRYNPIVADELKDELLRNTVVLLSKCMITDTDISDSEAVMAVANRFECLPSDFTWSLEALGALEARGQENLVYSANFDDTLYWTAKLPVYVEQYDFILVDESQDLNKIQRQLIKKMCHEYTRVIFVGDTRQSIYGFAGADCKSMQSIKEEFNCTEYPLSICYRCPTSHLDLAREFVPSIEARPDAPTGIVEYFSEDKLYTKIQLGSNGVICRTCAPLLSCAFSLLKAGIGVIVKGRDIGKGLQFTITQISKSRGYKWESFLDAVDTFEQRTLARMSADGRVPNQASVSALTDRLDCIRVIYERLKSEGRLRGIPDLMSAIDGLFSDDNTNGKVLMSSIHRAKGLEFDNVYILHPALMPHKSAKSEDELQQERNLIYVALTRSRNYLGFVD